MIGIIVAMEEEIQFLLSKMCIEAEQNYKTLHFYIGKFAQKDIVVVKSGIGKVNAALATTLLIKEFAPSYIINTGSSAGLHPQMNITDIAISARTFHHDFDLTPIGFSKGEIPGLPIYFDADEKILKHIYEKHLSENIFIGDIASGDHFVTSESYVKELKSNNPNLIAIDMEAVAIAQVCYFFDCPYIVVRSISDVPGKEEQHISFDKFVQLAGAKSAEFALQILL
jgi:adenosylhomocysteine nucleosidase